MTHPNGQESLLRRAMLALVMLGAAGLSVELLLLEHYEDPWQWAPLALLGTTLLSGALVTWRRSAATVAAFRAVMVLCVLSGAVGMWLHYAGNAEFERERDATLRGFAFFWETVRGATPTLAPGAMAQLGLLGLLWSWRLPLRAPASAAPESHFHPAPAHPRSENS